MAILQCDLSRDSFIAAFSLEDGAKIWSTPRDEIPSWSSPVIWRNSQRVEIVTNAAQYARSYDPKTGAELWRLAKKSEVTIPAPVCGKDLLYITSGNRPIQPIFAIKPGASGENPELIEMTMRFRVSLALTVPILALMISEMLPHQPLHSAAIHR